MAQTPSTVSATYWSSSPPDSNGQLQPDDVWSPSLREAVFSNNEFDAFNDQARQNSSLASTRSASDSRTTQSQDSAVSHHPASAHSNIGHPSSTRLPSFSSLQRNLNANPRLPSIARPHTKRNISISRSYPLPSDHLHLPPILPPPQYADSRHHSHAVTPASPHGSVEGYASPLSNSPGPDFNDFVDLTKEPQNMAPRRSQRSPIHSRSSQLHEIETPRPVKRLKTSTHSINVQKVEEVDLRDVDDDVGLSKVLEQQRMATVKAQQEQADRPLNLSTIQCIICMEAMTDITATTCGHLFCHSCLMEALIAGENQGPEPGKGISKCPVCRKKVKRPKDNKDTSNCVPLELKLLSRARVVKSNCKAQDRAG